ncbi:hypothetical protein H1C71_042367 [Ictidomys tridecemlineatus]|nr:hypothetical protein H1C71_042367 [Ictidomys tridecemlineatus]
MPTFFRTSRTAVVTISWLDSKLPRLNIKSHHQFHQKAVQCSLGVLFQSTTVAAMTLQTESCPLFQDESFVMFERLEGETEVQDVILTGAGSETPFYHFTQR